MEVKVGYVEPDDYFPEETRKKYKLGEYAEEDEQEAEDKNNKDANDAIRNFVNE